MKKLFFKTAFIGLFVSMVGYNVYQSGLKKELSNLILDNVEALANDDENKSGYGYVNCDGHNIICTGNGKYNCCVG